MLLDCSSAGKGVGVSEEVCCSLQVPCESLVEYHSQDQSHVLKSNLMMPADIDLFGKAYVLLQTWQQLLQLPQSWKQCDQDLLVVEAKSVVRILS
jgi:hypothetical protein